MKKPSSAHCHFLLRDTAVEMAHEAYGALMKRNDWYALWKQSRPGLNVRALESRWVSEHWGDFIEGARAVLASMLERPIAEGLKDQIAEALILDNTLVRGRAKPLAVIGEV